MFRVIALAVPFVLFGADAAAATARFALVVGNNHPLEGSDYEPLRYADDDALRFAEFMTRIGADVELFTDPDADSAEQFRALAARAQSPRRALVLDALERLETKLREAQGDTREVYVYFSGHGSVTSSRAYLHLRDAPFSRTDMRALVLDRLSAERVHLIVDSCHSYFMVNPRGDKIPVAPEDDGLDRYPRAGFLLSTSAKKEVQEWSGYRAGVFSYQLLGAMQGAADVDLDGRVTYAEAHAYVVAANSGVENPTARVQPFVRRPTVGDAVLVELTPRPTLARLELPQSLGGHLFIVDARGHRLLDAHKPAGQPLGLYLPPARAMEVWLDDRPYGAVDELAPHVVRAFADPEERPELESRGVVADEFRKNLFRRPLTREFVAGLDAAVSFHAVSTITTDPLRQDEWRPLSLGLVIAGGVALAAGVAATALYVDARSDASPEVFTDANRDDVTSARGRADTSRALMVGAYASGAAMMVGGLLYELLTDEPGLDFRAGDEDTRTASRGGR